ncbi:GGDEF domain-containing protein [Enterobacteriaceae bacterium G50]|nr:GGDEF domain-containing protein [Enterobacteriaceae bacterium G50]
MIVKKSKKKYFFIWATGLMFASLLLLVNISLDVRYARADAARKIRTGIVHSMYLNNHISSMMSMYNSNENNKKYCDKKPEGGVFYYVNGGSACYLKQAMWFIEHSINKEILASRYFSFPGEGVLYFFNKKKFSGLKYEQYVDAITMSGRFSKDYFIVDEKGNPLSYREATSGLDDVYLDKVTGEPVLTLVSPVIDYSSNKTAGALFQDLSVSVLREKARKAHFPAWMSLAVSNKTPSGIRICFFGNCGYDGPGSYKEDYANELDIYFGIDWLELLLDYKVLLGLWLGYAILSFFVLRKLYANELRHKLESLTDELTKAYNRKALNEMDIRRFKSFIIFDCNNFKKINDTFGHPAGDAALKALSTFIKDNITESDVLIRYGGDEFVVLCAEGDASSVASRIQEELQSKKFMFNGKEINLTVSYGVSEIGDSFASTLYDADQKLYTNKEYNKFYNQIHSQNIVGGLL